MRAIDPTATAALVGILGDNARNWSNEDLMQYFASLIYSGDGTFDYASQYAEIINGLGELVNEINNNGGLNPKGSASDRNITIHVMTTMDGKVVAETVSEYLADGVEQ